MLLPARDSKLPCRIVRLGIALDLTSQVTLVRKSQLNPVFICTEAVDDAIMFSKSIVYSLLIPQYLAMHSIQRVDQSIVLTNWESPRDLDHSRVAKSQNAAEHDWCNDSTSMISFWNYAGHIWSWKWWIVHGQGRMNGWEKSSNNLYSIFDLCLMLSLCSSKYVAPGRADLVVRQAWRHMTELGKMYTGILVT